MPAPGESVVLVVVIGLAVLLSVRILTVVPGWARRARTPEARALRVIGVGGGGSNAVDRMVRARIQAISFVSCNTDAQALRRSSAKTKLRIGDSITGGLGAGGDPEIGRRAAEEDHDRIARAVAGADLVFVTAGLGGGTGSGAAPIVAASARDQGALTIAVVTKPFGFEGSQRKRIADTAAAELAANVDVLLQTVQGIIDLIAAQGLINLDFADIRSVMKDAGPAVIGLGRGSGEHRATDAARQAIASPLLESNIDGARGILFNISGPADLGLREVRLAADAIRERADVDANVIFGATFSESLGEDVLITLIATGLNGHDRTQKPAVEASSNGGHPPVDGEVRPPRRPARTVKEAPGVDALASPAEVSDQAPEPSPAPPEDDTEVPSFLRR